MKNSMRMTLGSSLLLLVSGCLIDWSNGEESDNNPAAIGDPDGSAATPDGSSPVADGSVASAPGLAWGTFTSQGEPRSNAKPGHAGRLLLLDDGFGLDDFVCDARGRCASSSFSR